MRPVDTDSHLVVRTARPPVALIGTSLLDLPLTPSAPQHRAGGTPVRPAQYNSMDRSVCRSGRSLSAQ